MNVSVKSQSIGGISEHEWKVRCELAGLYRLLAYYKMTDLIYTHISARLPGPEHHFLINQYGVMFHEMRASDIIKIDLDGNVVDQRPDGKHRVNAAGFTIHSAIHAARSDLMCVVHTHTAAGVAVSAQKHGLLPISQQALRFYGHIAYHGYEGLAVDLSERERLVADLGGHDAMILVNHGLLVGGRTIPEAFNSIYFLERACQAQIAALAGGTDLVTPPEAVRLHTAAQMNREPVPDHVNYAWEAALRQVERDQPSFRS
jgi:ribulose-5-phosphate 4-epimerase/fuculose-1-phosphate aldolase